MNESENINIPKEPHISCQSLTTELIKTRARKSYTKMLPLSIGLISFPYALIFKVAHAVGCNGLMSVTSKLGCKCHTEWSELLIISTPNSISILKNQVSEWAYAASTSEPADAAWTVS